MIKRPLLWAAILFFLGTVLAVSGINRGMFCVLLIISFLFLVNKTGKAAAALLLTIMFLTGFIRMDIACRNRDTVTSEYMEKSGEMALTVTEFSENNRAIASLKDGKKNIRVYLSVKEDVKLSPGDIIKGEIKLRTPISSKTAETDFADYLSSRGVFLSAYAESVRVTGRDTSLFPGLVYSARTYMDRLGERYFKGNDRALFNAMVFGDKRLVSDKLFSALQASGLNHIAVVSGMHLSVMIAFLMFFVHKLFGKNRLGYILAILAAVFITFVTGAGASVVRALVMCSLYQLGRILYRESDILTSLSFSALLLLAVNPFLIFSAGFILSLLSVLGIILYNDKIQRLFEHIMPKPVAAAASLSLSAQLTVTPALVYYFGIVTPYALLSNIMAVTFSTAYVVLGIIFIFLSPLKGVALLLKYILSGMSAVLESVCFTFSELPEAAMKTGNMGIISAMAWLVILYVIYFYPEKPERILKIMAGFVAATLIISFTFPKQGMKVEVFRYGDAAMTMVQSQSGKRFLIDCPDIYDAQMLGSEFSPVECAVLTTTDTAQAAEGAIRKIVAPEELFSEEEKEELLKKTKEEKIRTVFAKAHGRVMIEGVQVDYLSLENIQGKMAIKLEDRYKSIVSLQAFSAKDIITLLENGTVFRCDYLILPFCALPENTDTQRLCTGKII